MTMSVSTHSNLPKALNRDSLPLPKGAISVSRPDGVEMQTHAPSTGSLNASISELTLHEKSPNQSGWRRYFLSDIDKKWTELLLLACGFCSGLVDGLSFTYWWSFSNMQTGMTRPHSHGKHSLTACPSIGNIIWIALGISGKPDNPAKLWVKALISVGGFLLGNLCFILTSRLLGPLRRVTMITSFALQTILLLIPALLVQNHTVSPTPENDPTVWLQDVAIALISFQAAGQIIVSRLLSFPEIPTVALTALTCDLLLDEKLFQSPLSANPKRNRKMGFLLALFCGAMLAGGIAKGSGLACGLWLAMGLKACITVSWFVWNETETETQPTKSVV